MRRSTLRAPWALTLGEQAARPPSSQASCLTLSASATLAALLALRQPKFMALVLGQHYKPVEHSVWVVLLL